MALLPSEPIRIAHVITGLGVGGAEMMLLRLLKGMDRHRFDCRVISLTGRGVVGEQIQALGIPLIALGMHVDWPDPRGWFNLARELKVRRFHLVQTWMYHADFLGGLAARWVGLPVIWGIRNGNLQLKANRRRTLWVIKACAWLSSRLPRKIVVCAQSAALAHAELGYAAEKMIVLPNGYDIHAYRPDPQARVEARRELGLREQTPLIGLFARFHPVKDHAGFIRAASSLTVADAHFLLCGEGVDWNNESLSEWIRSAGLRERFHLLGRRSDIPRLMAALDLLTSCSAYGEAFPNVVAEAMACGIPCVVTDVGDSALILDGAGLVIPQQNALALACAWQELLALPPEERRRMGLQGRRRVEEHYNIPRVAELYQELYLQIVTTCG